MKVTRREALKTSCIALVGINVNVFDWDTTAVATDTPASPSDTFGLPYANQENVELSDGNWAVYHMEVLEHATILDKDTYRPYYTTTPVLVAYRTGLLAGPRHKVRRFPKVIVRGQLVTCRDVETGQLKQIET